MCICVSVWVNAACVRCYHVGEIPRSWDYRWLWDNWTGVLWKISKHSQLLTHVSSPDAWVPLCGFWILNSDLTSARKHFTNWDTSPAVSVWVGACVCLELLFIFWESHVAQAIPKLCIRGWTWVPNPPAHPDKILSMCHHTWPFMQIFKHWITTYYWVKSISLKSPKWHRKYNVSHTINVNLVYEILISHVQTYMWTCALNRDIKCISHLVHHLEYLKGLMG